MSRRAAPASLAATHGTVPLRRLVRCLDGRRVPLSREERATRSGPYPYWGAGGVVDSINDFLFDETLVLLGEDGAPFFDDTRDVSFVVDERVWVNNHIHVLRPLETVDPRRLCNMLNATDYSMWITGSTRDKLTQDEMMQIRLPAVDVTIQQVAVERISCTAGPTHAAVERLRRQIMLLREHRQAQITAAVTGELEVPGVAV